jgi:leucyl/phenylalanyl-tRNA---protein transferase
MSMFVLDPTSGDLRFPPVDLASREGLLAMGGDLRAERLLVAYRSGIFPWYNDGQPILWWSPDPRAVLFTDRIKISRSLRKTLHSGKFVVTLDRCFVDVVRGCAAPRDGQHGTWITNAMLNAYAELHRRGHAHSVETWREGTLVGGLYGVSVGGVFCGESMFSRDTDASKVALVALACQLTRWGYTLIDCQLPTPHLASLGAETVSRAHYLELLQEGLEHAGHAGAWHFDSDLFIV